MYRRFSVISQIFRGLYFSNFNVKLHKTSGFYSKKLKSAFGSNSFGSSPATKSLAFKFPTNLALLPSTYKMLFEIYDSF